MGLRKSSDEVLRDTGILRIDPVEDLQEDDDDDDCGCGDDE
jgi:hypothetical protein